MWVPLAWKSHIISNPTELDYFLALEGMETTRGNWGTLEKWIPLQDGFTAIKYPYLHSGFRTKTRNCENKSKYISQAIMHHIILFCNFLNYHLNPKTHLKFSVHLSQRLIQALCDMQGVCHRDEFCSKFPIFVS